MKHTILTCGKFQRLRYALHDHMYCTVIGALEALYLYGNANGPVMRASDVEMICGWTCGQSGRLLAALTDTGNGEYTNFLDVLPEGKVQIHDFMDHAPDSVKARERAKTYRKKQKFGTMTASEFCGDLANSTLSAERNEQFVTDRTSCTEALRVRNSNDKPNQTKPNQIQERVTNVTHVAKPKRDIVLSPEEQEVIDYWDAKPGMSQTRGMTAKRQKAIRAILKDPATKDLWKTSIDHVVLSDHHMGRKPGATWKIDFDWWCRSDRVLRFAEMAAIEKRDKFGVPINPEPEEELGF